MHPHCSTEESITSNPSDEKWWVQGDKYLAGTCACESCRLASGFEIQTWAFIPRANISIVAPDSSRTEVPLDFESLPTGALRSYQSSQGVVRHFCGGCGATTTLYYSDRNPLLIDNDGGPDNGGFHAYNLNSKSPLKEVTARTPGRSKLITTVYDINKKDILITIMQPDSVVRAYKMPKSKQIKDADFKVLGDWSALCSWKSPAGNDYVYLFGKGQAVQLLLQETKKSFKFIQ
ncbi:hypothetical protein FOMG_19595, partial [Fusarium oxysporum f. sp. melonis 26406]